MSTGTPEVGRTEPGPVEILLLPALGIVLAGVITGLIAAVTVTLVKSWTGAGLRPPEPGYAPWRRLRVPVGGSVLGTVSVFALEVPSAWVGLGSSATGALLRVVAVGVLLGMALHWVHFGDTAWQQRRAGRYSYGVFAAVWTASTAIYYVVV